MLFRSRRTTPLAARADMATIRQVAWCLGWDPGAFAIAYTEIRASPDEEREQREADEWEVAQGLASVVDVYQRRNPGLTREEAIAQLQRVALDAEAVKAATGGAADIQATALNGAQVQAAMGIVSAVAAGQIPRDSALGALVRFFQLTEDDASAVLGSVGSTFTPATPPAA